MAEPAKSLMDLINAVDKVPADYPFHTLYRLLLPSDPRPHGFLLRQTVDRMPWTPEFAIDHSARTVQLAPSVVASSSSPGQAITAAFQAVVDAAVSQNSFPLLHGQHSEHYLVMGARDRVEIERYISPLFGIASRGAHMTAYVPSPTGNPAEMKIWIAKRSAHLYSYPGKLDSSVAGGVKATDSPLECIVAEADEEASLDRGWVRARARAAGVVSYMAHSERNATMQPVVLYVYDLACAADVVLRPGDDEVEEFRLMGVGEVREAMMQGRFKANVCLVMIDFFVRHGIITEGDEVDYVELVTRLRRKLPVPLTPGQV